MCCAKRMTFFPLGIAHYLIGGLLVGLGTGLIYLFTGYISGASGCLSSFHSFWSKLPFFQKQVFRQGRVWKSVLVLGLISGALIYSIVFNDFFSTSVQWWRLFLGGLLVGFGTRMSKGCTSGHGICGLSSFSLPSLIAVLTFMFVAIITAFVVSSFGVLP